MGDLCCWGEQECRSRLISVEVSISLPQLNGKKIHRDRHAESLDPAAGNLPLAVESFI